MRSKLISIIAALFIANQVTGIAVPAPEAEAIPNELEARSCNYKDPCTVYSGVAAGVYCGFCWQVQTAWVNADAYQLNPDGSCCNYERRSSCAAVENGYDASQCPI